MEKNKKCPFCKEDIKADATVCKHCGRDLKKAKNKKKAQIGCLIVFAVIALIIIIAIAVSSSDKSDPPITMKQWNAMSYESKEQWLKNDLQNNVHQNAEVSIQLEEMIRNRFNYPEDVDIPIMQLPTLNRATIGGILPTSKEDTTQAGIININGTGTAKNAYGVKAKFNYNVVLILRPDTIFVEDLKIN